MLTLLASLLSRNALAFAAIGAFVVWASVAVKKHDQRVARVAVQEVTEKARATVQKAKVAQRRVDPNGARSVLGSKYCTDCGQ